MGNISTIGVRGILDIAKTPVKHFANLILIVLSSVFLFSPESFADQKLIAIVKTEELSSYLRALKGVKQAINQSGVEVGFVEYTILDESTEKDKVLTEIKKKRPDLIVTIGSKATELVSQDIKDIPIVFSAVLNPAISGFVPARDAPEVNLTGASLDVPLRIQLEKFKLIVPDLKTLGVLYTSETEPLIREAQSVSGDLGIELVPLSIESEKEIPSALQEFKNEVDGIWAVADPLIFTPQSTQFILLFTLRNGLPLMGLTPSFVEAGALFTLAPDYKDVGRQAGEMALEIVSGKDPKQVSISMPRMIYLYLNLKTAEQINLKISPDLVEVAKEVFR
jgi:putative ABC transport system substrate-binding protein